MAPIHLGNGLSAPWSCIHIDYASPLQGHTFLVVVDVYSKWMDVRPVKSATSAATISQLRAIFATHGIPELLVSNNGPAFTSSEFEEFMHLNGIRHTTSARYHPATNGLAERAVQTFQDLPQEGTILAAEGPYLLVPPYISDYTTFYHWDIPS